MELVIQAEFGVAIAIVGAAHETPGHIAGCPLFIQEDLQILRHPVRPLTLVRGRLHARFLDQQRLAQTFGQVAVILLAGSRVLLIEIRGRVVVAVVGVVGHEVQLRDVVQPLSQGIVACHMGVASADHAGGDQVLPAIPLPHLAGHVVHEADQQVRVADIDRLPT